MNDVQDELLSEFTIIESLTTRVSELKQLLTVKRKELRNAPEGFLRISKSNGVVQYYRRADAADKRGKYIPAKDKELAEQLAQKEYDKKIIRAAEREIRLINYTLKSYNQLESKKQLAEKNADCLAPLRRALVKPVHLSDSEYAHRWQALPYKGKSFSPDAPSYITARGERVRSKSENLIADTLYRLSIPYRYEFPQSLKNSAGERLTIHPDFTCLDLRTRREFFWEHFGMMDNPEYSESAIRKLRLYEANGFLPGKNLIITTETSKLPVNSKQIERIAKAFFAWLQGSTLMLTPS